jgi:hypothetical protein
VTVRRFPPPWSVEDIGVAFKVCDSTGQRLAYVYFEEEPGRRSVAKLLKAVEPGAVRKWIACLMTVFLFWGFWPSS